MNPSASRKSQISPQVYIANTLPSILPHDIPTKQTMSTTSTVCQGLQSCLTPFLLEPSALMHQLAPSKQSPSLAWPHKQATEPDNSRSLSCWNVMQSATRKSTYEPEKIYTHPLSKLSSSCLSSQSLEMCTESLGTETGSGIDSSTYEFTHRIEEKQSSIGTKQPKARKRIKKVRERSNFPPPLTSISGSGGVHVEAHREAGRLVIRAFSVSSSASCFHAERENGRLRLSLLKQVENEHENCDHGGRVGCKIGGGDWSGGTRCNGDTRCRKGIQSLQYCVAIS